MSIFSFFRSASKTSATQAKERLQIVMAHERIGRTGPDYLPMLQQELLSVIAKYVDIDENKVEVKLDRGGDCSTLEVNIELPGRDAVRSVTGGRPAAGAGPAADAKAADPKASESKSGETKTTTPPSAGAVLTNGGVSKRH